MKNTNKFNPHKQVSKTQNRVISGILSVNTRGIGYIKTLDKDEEDIEIQNSNLNTALNGDTVTVQILPKSKGVRVNGKVINIDKRAKKSFVGILEKENGKYFLLPDDRKMYVDILITDDSVQKSQAEIKQKVLVKITKWEKGTLTPQGELVQILGQAGEHNVEMESILYEKGFEIGFPDIVENEAHYLEKTEKPIPQKEIAKRRDLRNTLTFTIDPKDAKDFDDAISIK